MERDDRGGKPKCGPMKKATKPLASAALTAEWPFPTRATIGSTVRAKGIEREMKAHLAFPDRKHLTVEGGQVRLSFDVGEDKRLEAVAAVIAGVLDRIEALPVLPREIEDILTISAGERMKWLKDGRLKSAGTRTVKLRGRARAVTFHVFEPSHVEDVLDRDMPAIWRVEDGQAATEARRCAAGKAALTRTGKRSPEAKVGSRHERTERLDGSDLKDWEAFASQGWLR